MADLPFKAIDADQHFYEALDCCTRYLDPQFRDRGIKAVQQGTHTVLLAGREVFRFIRNPTFDPIIVAGCLDPLFRGQIPEGVDPASLSQVEPLNPAYQNAAQRIVELDAQEIEATIMFPTLAVGVEQALRFDVPALMATITAYNQWIEEDWGFDNQSRIWSTPVVCFADPELALAEVERLIERGAKVVNVRPAPVPDGHGGGRSLGHPTHDPVWAALAAADIPVCYHLADSGYDATVGAAWGGPSRMEPFNEVNVLSRLLVSDRAIHDTMASLIVDGVFHRHPTLRTASIENGSDWAALLVKRLRKQANQTPWAFHEDPLETLRRHVWVMPYYEEDMRKLADLIGVERVLFGSDWPHGESLANPTDFVKELHAFSNDEIVQVMRTNVLELMNGTN